VLLVACASSEGPEAADVDVLPTDDVLDSSIVVTPDPSGTSATLTVDTSIPLACAVIYGVDDDFGAIATDDDMDGGAHTDHAPTLLGLEPDTEYQYVLQGSDAAGNLYRSDVLTFTTPTATAIDLPGENAAPTGEVAAVSSEFSAGFAADHAIDGDPTTEWSTAGDGDDASIEVELPTSTDVVGFGLRSRSMGDGSSIIETYEVTVDGDEVLGPFEAGADGLAVSEVTATGQRFRFDAVSTSGGNTGAVEIEIYAAR
jgi:hypothetical protein